MPVVLTWKSLGPDIRPREPSRSVVLMMGRGGERRVEALNLLSKPLRPPCLSEDHEDLHGRWSFTRPMGASVEPYQARGLRPSTISHQVQTTTDFTVLSIQITLRSVPDLQFSRISGESSFSEDK
uniref:Uncharacterized protein n=1 Tax=Solanum tuberosum TaxID=4113 RepID=M1D9A1_SOLTU